MLGCDVLCLLVPSRFIRTVTSPKADFSTNHVRLKSILISVGKPTALVRSSRSKSFPNTARILASHMYSLDQVVFTATPSRQYRGALASTHLEFSCTSVVRTLYRSPTSKTVRRQSYWQGSLRALMAKSLMLLTTSCHPAGSFCVCTRRM